MSRDMSERTLDDTPGADDAPGDRAARARTAATPPSAEPASASGGAARRERAGRRGGRAGSRRAELEGDLDELVSTAAQRDEYLALAQRTQADFENYRKRVARDAALAQERGVAKLVKELLPALDNIGRALDEAAAARHEDDPLLAGVRLVRDELVAALVARRGRVLLARAASRSTQSCTRRWPSSPLRARRAGRWRRSTSPATGSAST